MNLFVLLCIKVFVYVVVNFEGLVVWVDDIDVVGGVGYLWKLVCIFDDLVIWIEFGVCYLVINGMGGDVYCIDLLDD